jgi:hypothetical protein
VLNKQKSTSIDARCFKPGDDGLKLFGSHFEGINRYRLCGLICLASDLHRMTFVASGFLRIGDGIERISCQQRELPRT